MWLAIKRLALGLSLVVAASAILLFSDLNRRSARTARPGEDVPQVAVLQFSSRPVLDETVSGMLDGLAREGFVEGRTVSIRRFNAENDLPTANAIAREMSSGRFKLVMTASTPCLQCVANANKAGKAIHVFGAVTDPFGAGVGISRENPLDHPKHLVGIGTFQPVERTFEIARQLYPALKKVGTVWNTAEACSEACVLKARAKCQELGLVLLEANVENSAGVLEAARAIVSRGAEALWVGGDNTVEVAVDSVVTAAREGRIPVFVNSPQEVEQGALFGLGANYYEVGLLAGELAGRILRGADPAAIEIRNVVPERLALNTDAIKGLKAPWHIPPSLMAKADIVIGEGHPKTPRAPAVDAAPLQKTWSVYIVRYNDAPLGEDATKGAVDGLAAAKLVAGRDYTVQVKSAQGEMAVLSSILDAAKAEADLLITFSTPTLQAAVHKFDQTPVIFSVVADAVVAGAGKSPEDHRPNITGITTLGAFDVMPRLLKACLPSVRRVGTVFTPSEDNSVHNKNTLARHLKEAGIELVEVPANTSAEVADAALSLCGKDIEALCQITDNLVAASFASIAMAAEKRRLPVFGFVSAQARDGAVLTLARDYYEAGHEAGLLAARVMRGQNPADIPFRNLQKTRLIVNLRQARRLNIAVPESVIRQADEVMK